MQPCAQEIRQVEQDVRFAFGGLLAFHTELARVVAHGVRVRCAINEFVEGAQAPLVPGLHFD